MRVLLVDAANVVGARPDGWWRDRAGATARLLARLARLPGRSVDGVVVDEVVVVVEGAARDVGATGGVRLVRALGSGDDALAAAADLAAQGRAVLAVTADRGLRARLPEATAVTGPGRLLDVLEHLDVPDRMADNGPG